MQDRGSSAPLALLGGDVLGDVDVELEHAPEFGAEAEVVVLLDGLALHGQTLRTNRRNGLDRHRFGERPAGSNEENVR